MKSSLNSFVSDVFLKCSREKQKQINFFVSFPQDKLFDERLTKAHWTINKYSESSIIRRHERLFSFLQIKKNFFSQKEICFDRNSVLILKKNVQLCYSFNPAEKKTDSQVWNVVLCWKMAAASFPLFGEFEREKSRVFVDSIGWEKRKKTFFELSFSCSIEDLNNYRKVKIARRVLSNWILPNLMKMINRAFLWSIARFFGEKCFYDREKRLIGRPILRRLMENEI